MDHLKEFGKAQTAFVESLSRERTTWHTKRRQKSKKHAITKQMHRFSSKTRQPIVHKVTAKCPLAARLLLLKLAVLR
jgi:hypothetical protein